MSMRLMSRKPNTKHPRRGMAPSKILLLVVAQLMLLALGATEIAARNQEDRANQANYKLAQKFTNQFVNQYVYSSSVRPEWIGETDRFWYSYQRADGWHYYLVDPSEATKKPLFDRAVMAANLSTALNKALDTTTLNLGRLTSHDDGNAFRFRSDGRTFQYTLANKSFREITAVELEAEQKAAEEQAKKEEEENEDEDEEKDEDEQDEDEKQEEQDEDNEGDDEDADDEEKEDTSYRNYAPDKSCYVYLMENNLYFAEEGKEDEAVQLTDDGEEDYIFTAGFNRNNRGNRNNRNRRRAEAFDSGVFEFDQKSYDAFFDGEMTDADFDINPNLLNGVPFQDEDEEESEEDEGPKKTYPGANWSEDSKFFHITRRDSRGVQDLFLVNSLTEPRPALEQYGYPMPGEEAIRRTELYTFKVDGRELAKVEPKWKHEFYQGIEWIEPAGNLRMLRQSRTLRDQELCVMNLETGESTPLISEKMIGGNIAGQRGNQMRYIKDGEEILWWSERSGWGQYYRYDKDGNLLNAVTSGPARFSNIVDVDEDKGLMWVIGNGREKGESVYNNHLYRVFLDGTGLTLLDPGDAHHSSTLSPSKKYVVDNCSRPDMAPKSFLRDDKGNMILELETMDLSRLESTGWTMPETFVVKAADGVTDLHGNMWKPFDFDPNKKYPIILHVYPGPQTENVTRTFNATGGGRQQMAQLGFIVVQVGHRGGTPERSKAYHNYGYFNLRDYGLVDKKAAVIELGQQYPFVDVERVGIYGHSGGGFMTAAALLLPPYNDFFDVGVSSAGNHDNNVYNNTWSERYHGLKEYKVEIDAEGNETRIEEKKEEGGGGEDGDINFQSLTEEQQQRVMDLFRRGVINQENFQEYVRNMVEEERRATRKSDEEDKEDEEGEGEEVEEEEKRIETRYEIHIPANHEIAENLKGHLLLVHGDMDNNVHHAGTMRLVNALIKANKRFEFMMFPGKRHGFGDMQPYFTQMMWEYFSEHLLGDYQGSADMTHKD